MARDNISKIIRDSMERLGYKIFKGDEYAVFSKMSFY